MCGGSMGWLGAEEVSGFNGRIGQLSNGVTAVSKVDDDAMDVD